jgi:hypothetical protein
MIYHEMWDLGKIRVTFGKVSTNTTDNIFPKYLLQYLHEIARKYPREKKYSSSFYDSVDGQFWNNINNPRWDVDLGITKCVILSHVKKCLLFEEIHFNVQKVNYLYIYI